MDINSDKIKKLQNRLDVLKFSRKLILNTNYGLPNKVMGSYNEEEYNKMIDDLKSKIKKLELNSKIKKILKDKNKDQS